MLIKQKPEDFIVYEVADIAPEGKGDFALYRLSKRGATTWDVIGDLARRLRLKAHQIHYGGLKDRHALSYQYLTIKHGPKKDLEGKNYRLEYLGQVSYPMSKARLKGNYFRLLVQGVSTEKIPEEVEKITRYGVVNYFDDQRFGSVRESREFVARELILGHYEKALYLLLVESSHYEMKRTWAFRKCLKKNWPRVEECLPLAPSPWEKNLLLFLTEKKPSKRTFKRAFSLVDSEYLLMLCHVYQAYIWNETVKLYLKEKGIETFAVPYLLGELFFYRELKEEEYQRLSELKIPLPSPRLKLEPEIKAVMEKVLQREGIGDLSRFRTLAKGAVFKTYPREMIVVPQQFKFQMVDSKKVWLEFFLPKGSYATIVLKRLFPPN